MRNVGTGDTHFQLDTRMGRDEKKTYHLICSNFHAAWQRIEPFFTHFIHNRQIKIEPRKKLKENGRTFHPKFTERHETRQLFRTTSEWKVKKGSMRDSIYNSVERIPTRTTRYCCCFFCLGASKVMEIFGRIFHVSAKNEIFKKTVKLSRFFLIVFADFLFSSPKMAMKSCDSDSQLIIIELSGLSISNNIQLIAKISNNFDHFFSSANFVHSSNVSPCLKMEKNNWIRDWNLWHGIGRANFFCFCCSLCPNIKLKSDFLAWEWMKAKFNNKWRRYEKAPCDIWIIDSVMYSFFGRK